MKRKNRKQYYFSCEGYTEKWYLEHLRDKINQNDESILHVIIEPKVMSPQKYAKTVNTLDDITAWHIADYEGAETEFQTKFRRLIDEMAKVRRSGRGVKYKLGYSNLAFELWMILHKQDSNAPKTSRKDYIDELREAYSEKFEDLDTYKEKRNFERCLAKIDLDNIREAVRRAERIMAQRKQEEHINRLKLYKTYEYYETNPALSIWVPVKEILKDCGLL